MDNMEKYNISLRIITEDNFIEAFNLKLANGQERFVSNPIRSLAQAYVYKVILKYFILNLITLSQITLVNIFKSFAQSI